MRESYSHYFKMSGSLITYKPPPSCSLSIMSWFSGNSISVTELDSKIIEATSESIPNGEIDISIALEITDLIRSRNLPPKQCMRSLKKRLTNTYNNPNLITSTLKLIDLCIKNGGYHFLVEISSKEFIDYLIDYIFKIHYNTKDFKVQSNNSKLAVGELILKLLKEWSFYFQNNLQLNYVEKIYKSLLNQGFHFEDLDPNINQLSSNFIDLEAPPDWVDNDECMICYDAFSVLNRKHHCRSCGGVFCSKHSLHSIPLVHLGLLEPVRVCDNCYEKIKLKNSGNLQKIQNNNNNTNDRSVDLENDEDEQLRKAIELSLKESGQQVTAPAPAPAAPAAPSPPQPQDDESEEMKAAIAASLKEFEAQEKLHKQHVEQENYLKNQPQPQPQPASDFYANLPFDNKPQQNVQQQQAQQVQQVQQFQPQQPQQPISEQPTKPQVEDLNQQEEESINLFITLMNNTKNDASKQNNIIYDRNLSELHNKVIQLKPKLNKSLRLSIERYDHFLELNNKISTITRLYDQFLESKLNQAYNNHYISSYPPQQSQQPTGQRLPPQQTNPYAAPYPLEELKSQNSLMNSPPNHTLPTQPSSFHPNPQQGNPSYPSNSSIPTPFDSNDHEYNQERQQSAYPSYPTAPSYPPEDSDSNEESDNESVESRYPVLPGHDQNTNPSQLPNSDPSQLSNTSAPIDNQPQRVHSVNTRYPPIERIDSEFSQVSSPINNLQQELPSVPHFDQPLLHSRTSSSATSKHRVEPEPLIEL